ncbi:hypothetical protein [Burkholderia gladioli]|uniref:hypothetical protein n=1 Tax=Burkholderia gladioli TaxID=28095 RepID=UPI000CFFA91A|nr:hypothetical protein [Burkholderia gladioli]MBJ9660434.1 hypothetical protein [Burkholderia gladioli]MDN7804547.1 hypothetical protein [Burkholderia gladioli]PRE89387.1 hypothetical protein C6Q13_07975 [Burkholderia gladioli]
MPYPTDPADRAGTSRALLHAVNAADAAEADALAWQTLGAHLAGMVLGVAILAAATVGVCGLLRLL